MYKTYVSATLLVLIVAALGYAATNECRSDKQCVVTVAVYEEADGESKKKHLGGCTIAVMPGRPFAFNSEGVLKEVDLKIGTEVTGKITPTEEGLAQVALRISTSHDVLQQNDRESTLVRTLAFDIRTTATPGQTVRFNSSKTQWCELTIEVSNGG